MPRKELASASEECQSARESAATRLVDISRLESQLEAARLQASAAMADAEALKCVGVQQAAAAVSAEAAAEARMRSIQEISKTENQMLKDRLNSAEAENERLRAVTMVINFENELR